MPIFRKLNIAEIYFEESINFQDQYYQMRKTNRRRFRTDGDSTQLTFNVDTSKPFTIKSEYSPLLNFKSATHHTNLHGNNQASFSNPEFSWTQENHPIQGEIQNESYGRQLDHKQINTKNCDNKLILVSSNGNDYIPAKSEEKTLRVEGLDGFDLIQEEQIYLKHKEEEADYTKKLYHIQELLRKKKEFERMQIEDNFGKIGKISFINTLLLRIMDKISGKDKIQAVCKQNTIDPNKNQIQPKFNCKQKLPTVLIFHQPKDTGQCMPKIYRKYQIKYQIRTVRHDTGVKMDFLKGSFYAGQINPFLHKTMQFIINCILKKTKPVMKYLVQQFQILEQEQSGEVLIRLYCIVRPLVLPKLQCTFISLQETIVKGLRVYSPNIQITFHSWINIKQIDLNCQMQINERGVKLSQKLDQKVELMFRNLWLGQSSREEFIKFFYQNSNELSLNFVDYFYDKYINIGVASL